MILSLTINQTIHQSPFLTVKHSTFISPSVPSSLSPPNHHQFIRSTALTISHHQSPGGAREPNPAGAVGWRGLQRTTVASAQGLEPGEAADGWA